MFYYLGKYTLYNPSKDYSYLKAFPEHDETIAHFFKNATDLEIEKLLLLTNTTHDALNKDFLYQVLSLIHQHFDLIESRFPYYLKNSQGLKKLLSNVEQNLVHYPEDNQPLINNIINYFSSRNYHSSQEEQGPQASACARMAQNLISQVQLPPRK